MEMAHSVKGTTTSTAIRVFTALTLGACVLSPVIATIIYKMSDPGQQMSAPSINGQTLDLSGIDRQLYRHMQVGRPYTIAGKTWTPPSTIDFELVSLMFE